MPRITENEFDMIMEEIERALQSRHVQIHLRPVEAISEFATRLKIDSPIPLTNQAPIPGLYEGASLAAHIREWYQKRYEDRLKVSMGPGSAALLIKGEPWRINFPCLYGAVELICDPDMEKYKSMPKIRTDGVPPLFNVLGSINGFTPSIAKSLTVEEQKEIFNFFVFGLKTMERLYLIRGIPLLEEAVADLKIAVSNIVDHKRHLGLSKWSSLQFTEKVIKAYLRINGLHSPTHTTLII